jgi:putative peptidoglycan lipid II flippase
MAAYQLNDLVSTALAGRAGEGVVSSLQYSLRLQELILGVFAVSIGTVLLPNLTEYAKTSQWDVFKKRLVSSINIIALITIPITFFSLVQGQSLIRLLFQSRSFDETSVSLTLAAFTFHMPGLFFIALNRILAPAFYAQSDTKSPTLAGIISFAVNICFAAVLVRHYRGAGIALALSLASAVNTIFLMIFLKRKPNIILTNEFNSIFIYIFKIIVISASTVVPIYFLSPVLLNIFANNGRIISYGVPLAVNSIIYILLGLSTLALVRDKNLLFIFNMFRKKVKSN